MLRFSPSDVCLLCAYGTLLSKPRSFTQRVSRWSWVVLAPRLAPALVWVCLFRPVPTLLLPLGPLSGQKRVFPSLPVTLAETLTFPFWF